MRRNQRKKNFAQENLTVLISLKNFLHIKILENLIMSEVPSIELLANFDDF